MSSCGVLDPWVFEKPRDLGPVKTFEAVFAHTIY